MIGFLDYDKVHRDAQFKKGFFAPT